MARVACAVLVFVAGAFLFLVSPSQTFQAQNDHPVLWRPSKVPITEGNYEVNLIIKLLSPCEGFTSEILHEDVTKEARQLCDKNYQELILDELKKLNLPERRKNSQVLNRQPRELLTFLVGALILVIIASAAVGTVGFLETRANANEIASMGEKQNKIDHEYAKLKQQLANLETRVEKLRENFNDLLKRLERHETDYTQLKRKQIGTNFLISHITNRMHHGRVVFQEAARQLKKGEIYAPMLDFFNITLPCGDDCPIHLATARSFTFDDLTNEIMLNFYVPKISPKQKLVEADAFELMMKDDNNTCHVNYDGPKNVIITSNECITAVNVNIVRLDLILAPVSSCLTSSKLPDRKKYFRISHCEDAQKDDYLNFIQLKPFYGNIHLYCPGSNFSLGNKTSKCPDSVFIIPIAVNFSINDKLYIGEQIHISHQEELDPLYTLQTNWQLQPVLNFTELTIPAPPTTTMSSLDLLVELVDHPLGYVSLGMLLLLLLLVGIVWWICRRNRTIVNLLGFAERQVVFDGQKAITMGDGN